MLTKYLSEHPLLPQFLQQNLRIPFPRAAERAAWDAIPGQYKEEILREGKKQHEVPYPPLLATQFLAYTRTGDRRAYESPCFARRHKLIRAVLAESLSGKGEYLDDVIDGIWCICEETYWGISAHNGSAHPGARPVAEHPLPDTGNPYIDLFAAQTAACLSWTCHLLETELNAVTPQIIRRVRAEIEQRIVDPFLKRDDFWWMGMIRKDLNNWTPWILSNIMSVLILWERDDIRLSESIARALRMLDSYLRVMPPDGGCDEGAGYWNKAGGSLLDCLEHLYCLTGGKCNFYNDRLIRAIGEFPFRAHISGKYFWNFSDCDAMPQIDGERVFRYGERTENQQLMALGTYIKSGEETVFPLDTPEMYRVLCKLFFPVGNIALQEEPIAILPDLQIYAKSENGFYVAVKGGNNGESHNHNDVGSFLIYIDGQPSVIDLGNMVYTAKTFGKERYSLLNTRSKNHNVPIIGDIEQAAGNTYAARNVSINENGIRMDIAGAYPETAGVKKLLRKASFVNGRFTIRDQVSLKSDQPVTWVFMLREKPEISPGALYIEKLELRYAQELTAAVEEIPVSDERMAKNFPGNIYRLTLTSATAVEHNVDFTMKRR